jgi:hypothetical protein
VGFTNDKAQPSTGTVNNLFRYRHGTVRAVRYGTKMRTLTVIRKPYRSTGSSRSRKPDFLVTGSVRGSVRHSVKDSA